MNQKEAVPIEVRVMHPFVFSFYDRFSLKLSEYLPGIERIGFDDAAFKSGADYFRIIPDGFDKKKTHALALFWFVPHPMNRTLAVSYYSMIETGNALTHQEKERGSMVDKVIGIFPYVETRQDKWSITEKRGKEEVLYGESITAEIFAKGLKAGGYSGAGILDIHSHESSEYIKKEGIRLVNATAVPLFVDWVENKEIDLDKCCVAALDLGALQRCCHFMDLAKMSLKDQLVVFKKMRLGHHVVDDSTLLYGQVKDRDILLIDDLLDTGGSIGITCEALKKAGCGKIRVFLSHGVVSYPGRSNVKKLLDEGVIDSVVVTDSLPRGNYTLRGIEGVKVISVAPLMAGVGKIMSQLSDKQIQEVEGFKPFILATEDKNKVWEKVAGEIGV